MKTHAFHNLPAAQSFRLENGVTILAEEIPTVLSVAIGIVVGAGSGNEEDAVAGVSHFIEHMCFKGTPRRSAFEIAAALDAVGGKLNAYTTKESTTYHAMVPAEHLDVALDVVTDIVLNPLFEPKQIDLEKGVVLEEIKMYEDTPDDIIHDLFSQAIFDGHILGKPVIGRAETIKGMAREKILKYREEFYRPDNVIIAVAGAISATDIRKRMERLFGKLEGRAPTVKHAEPKITPHIQFHPKKTEQVHLCLGTKGISVMTEDRYPFSVLDNILGGSMSSRLFQEVREKRGLAYSIYTNDASYKDFGAFYVYAGTSKENCASVVNITLEQFSKMKKEGVTAAELKRAKDYFKGNLILSLESTGGRMGYMSKSHFYYGRVIPFQEIFEKVDRVTIDDIVRLANTYFLDPYLNLVAIGDFAEGEQPVKSLAC